jgi:hypothetical protein
MTYRGCQGIAAGGVSRPPADNFWPLLPPQMNISEPVHTARVTQARTGCALPRDRPPGISGRILRTARRIRTSYSP